MPMTVIAPRFAGESVITFEERGVRDPGPGELLVQVRANAVCGSERSQYYEGSEVTPGHEAAGVVAAAGAGTSIAEGTPGVVFLMDFCGVCRSCRLGLTNQCLDKRADMGFTADGGYGPYEVVHESNFFPIGTDLDPVEATLLLDVMGTTGHAIGRAERLRPDVESVYIAGAGPIGLGLLTMCKVVYGRDFPVRISDISPWRLDFARSFGADTLDSRDANALRELGVHDVAFDTTGKTSARTAAVAALGKRGVLVCVGHGETLTLDVSQDLIAAERAVMGSEYFLYDQFPRNVDLLRENREYLTRIITHRFDVTEIGSAFATFFEGETGKVVVTQGAEA